ncbi:UNVERIFIED_CONTAM: WAT1-related protein [Sesamum radiatum]|uniref:WAT1-related protein n=1 Tax=Sesamum radiatum TaxID=300843 RepID=A0AAW2N7M6_SESRA
MEGKGSSPAGGSFEKAKPYIAMICLQFGYAGMNIITKVSLNRGMSHYVLVVYRHAFATAAIAPFALILERKVRPKITFMIFMQLFVLGLLGPVIDQNLYYAGLKFTSPTFSCAMSNMLPAMTFVMAVICRMEKVDMKKVRCQAKVVGTIVTVGGAMLMTLYKGHVINMVWSNYTHPQKSYVPTTIDSNTDKDWVKGSILLIIATLAWASFFILQAITLRKYTAQLSLTALVCFMGTLQSIAVTFVMEHRPHAWAIGFDMNLLAAAYAAITLRKYTAQLSLTALVCFMGTLQSVAVTLVMEHRPHAWAIGFDVNLLAAAYAGIVSSSIAIYIQGLVMQKRGPVFVTAFGPLLMIIVAIMGSFILAEKIYVGGVLGAILIVIGLYSVLWGKYKEQKEKEAEEPILQPVKGGSSGVTTI